MLNRLFTPVELPKSSLQLDYSAPLMLMGSCFADNMGRLFSKGGFVCDTNPYGVLYNPASLAQALRQMISGRRYAPGDPELVHYAGCWHSLMHHSQFSAGTLDECVQKIHARMEKAEEILRRSQCLVLTFGSAYVYQWRDEGFVVGNCHKMPERNFTRRRLTVAEIVQDYACLIEELHEVNPSLRLLFTVSPIRHRRDGMPANQLSKATLLLAVGELVERFPEVCHYFPAYEVVMDELRDYRFYAEDMLHPSDWTVGYIWEKFCKSHVSEPVQKSMQEWAEICRGLEHRPADPHSEAYKQFLTQLELRICRFQAKNPTFDAQNELSICRTRLNK